MTFDLDEKCFSFFFLSNLLYMLTKEGNELSGTLDVLEGKGARQGQSLPLICHVTLEYLSGILHNLKTK